MPGTSPQDKPRTTISLIPYAYRSGSSLQDKLVIAQPSYAGQESVYLGIRWICEKNAESPGAIIALPAEPPQGTTTQTRWFSLFVGARFRSINTQTPRPAEAALAAFRMRLQTKSALRPPRTHSQLRSARKPLDSRIARIHDVANRNQMSPYGLDRLANLESGGPATHG